MVIIGAFIGTEDLGQYIMKALSDLKGGGKGSILGLCVAFIGLALDNLIRTWAERRKQFWVLVSSLVKESSFPLSNPMTPILVKMIIS